MVYGIEIESPRTSKLSLPLFLFICCRCVVFFFFRLLLQTHVFLFVVDFFGVFAVVLFLWGGFETISLIISIAIRCVGLFLFDSQLGLPQ